ncbi:PadR family transcriptional regulator [Nonomuraea sp. NPDC046570]|uniref:PadR family transcriptional regulator n=1 Tax=Nonomuraea sp. NPDC046570 TaxID=3155255 RepID=UPI0033FCEB44
MASGLRMTPQTLAVLRELLDDPSAEHYGLELRAATGLAGGTLYPILVRLEERGWVESRWDDPAAHQGRPPRRYYRITEDGLARARAATAPRAAVRWGPVGDVS